MFQDGEVDAGADGRPRGRGRRLFAAEKADAERNLRRSMIDSGHGVLEKGQSYTERRHDTPEG